VLSGALGIVDANGFVNKSGYYFQMWIASAANAPHPEDAGGGDLAGHFAGLGIGLCDPSETFWNCYAWPVSVGNSGNRAFMTNQSGDVLQTNNQVQAYSGVAGGPATGLESYDSGGNGDMGDVLSISGNPNAANDAGVWTVVN